MIRNEWVGLPRRVWLAVFIGAVLVPLALAVAYVYGGGIELLGNKDFPMIDRYVFTAVFLVGGIGVAGSFYAYFKDFSSSAAVLLSMAWGLFLGLEDLLVYAVSTRHSLPSVLPWLDDTVIGFVAGLMGFGGVSSVALFSVVVVTGVVLVFLVKTLVGVEERFLGYEI